MNKSEELYRENRKFLFQATDFIEPIIERGDGSFVWDVDGNKYLDINSGQFCLSFGHNYQKFNELVSNQLGRIFHTNTLTLTAEVFNAARAMAAINDPSLSKTIFLSTGAEANECALRYAKFITKRNKVVSLSQGYHGLTVGTQSLTMGGLWARPKIEGSLDIEAPDLDFITDGRTSEEYLEDCIQQMTDKIDTYHQDIAAVLVEPILGVGGMIFLPRKFLQRIREKCTEHSILLIFDECQTGFGRTGHWFCYQYYNVIPDMLVTAKAMGLGFPVSAVTFRQEVAEKIEGKITHFSSHQNDPLAARIVQFVIEEIKNNNLLEEIRNKGEYFLAELKKVSKSYDLIKNPRGLGLMLAFDIPLEQNENRALTKEVTMRMQNKGVLVQAIRQGITFRIMPNYFITYSEIDLFIDRLKNVFEEILSSDFH